MRKSMLFMCLVVFGCSSKQTTIQTKPLEPENGLKSAAAFTSIEDDEARARALFGEMAKVIQHPRCMNCHPSEGGPLQGDERKPHQPLVVRGEDGFGAPGMRCTTCHGDANFQNVPGDPRWHLAPIEMGWVGKSPAQICQQLKDTTRNGNKTLVQIAEHMTEDSLVGWAWNPPAHLEPAPGSQQRLGELTRAWVAAGAHCP